MQRNISSKLTFFFKFIFPLLLIPFFIVGHLSIMLDFSETTELPKVFVFLFLIGIIAFIYWFCIRIKKVELLNSSLIVSNYLKEIEIPLSEIDKITENIWMSNHPVTIHLKTSSEFGNKIVFIPTVRLFTFLSSHPIVSELRNLVKSGSLKSNY